MLKLAVPNKGRLSEPSLRLLGGAGIKLLDSGERKLFGATSNPNVQLLFARADDIPKYVEVGAADAGITGNDLVVEKGADVVILAKLGFGACRISLAVPAGSGIKSAMDLEGKRVATKLPNIARAYFRKKGVKAELVEVAGATEITPLLGLADAIIDHVSTGATLAVNKLVEKETLLESTACLIANRESAKAKRELLEELRLSFDGISAAERRKYLLVNAPSKAVLEKVVALIPGMESPTVLELAKKGEFAVHAVVECGKLAETIRKLKEAGAKDILVMGMERVIP